MFSRYLLQNIIAYKKLKSFNHYHNSFPFASLLLFQLILIAGLEPFRTNRKG